MEGAAAGIQLAHAGRKASTDAPWRGGHPVAPSDRGWQPVAPSAIAFDVGYSVPTALSIDALDAIASDFTRATERSREAGFDVVEIHMAHGYCCTNSCRPSPTGGRTSSAAAARIA